MKYSKDTLFNYFCSYKIEFIKYNDYHYNEQFSLLLHDQKEQNKKRNEIGLSILPRDKLFSF